MVAHWFYQYEAQLDFADGRFDSSSVLCSCDLCVQYIGSFSMLLSPLEKKSCLCASYS